MVDVVDALTRSRMMSGIRGRDTKPELLLRRALHALGFRYRLHGRDLPGRPDIVLPRHRAVVFVHGCFWHRHAGCRYASTPATRPEFWANKFRKNVERDLRNQEALLATAWRVAVVWECALKKHPAPDIAAALGEWLVSGRAGLFVLEYRSLAANNGNDPEHAPKGVSSSVDSVQTAMLSQLSVR